MLAKVVNNRIPQITNAQDAFMIKFVIKIFQIAQWLLKMAIRQSLKAIIKILINYIEKRIKKIKYRIGISKTYKVLLNLKLLRENVNFNLFFIFNLE